MSKKSKAPKIIIITTAALLGSLCTGLAVFVAKKEAALDSSVNYDYEQDRQMILGTQHTLNSLPVYLSMKIGSAKSGEDEQVMSLSSTDDMKPLEGQKSTAVWYDLSDWVKKYIGAKTFTSFINDGGYFKVGTTCNNATATSAEIQLTKAGIWFVSPATKSGDSPSVARADIIYQ